MPCGEEPLLSASHTKIYRPLHKIFWTKYIFSAFSAVVAIEVLGATTKAVGSTKLLSGGLWTAKRRSVEKSLYYVLWYSTLHSLQSTHEFAAYTYTGHLHSPIYSVCLLVCRENSTTISLSSIHTYVLILSCPSLALTLSSLWRGSITYNKVRLFWEGQKKLAKSSLRFWSYLVMPKP